jgi:hypothetical protein
VSIDLRHLEEMKIEFLTKKVAKKWSNGYNLLFKKCYSIMDQDLLIVLAELFNISS